MFTIDFTKPWLYKDVIYFNQGNLATNNILRCKLVTGGDTSLEGYIASVTFKTLSNAEINDFAAIVDAKNCVIDIKFPSNALEVGVNVLEIILTKGEGIDKVVTPSPAIKYEVWQCITTGKGIQGDNNYPILIDLISSVNNVVRVANDASVTAKVALSQASNMRDSIEDALARANETIKNTNNAKNEALESVKDVNRAIAAGTQDLEVKAAREDMDGVVYDTLKERLENDLKIGSKSLKQEVLDLAGLKESQDMAYSTDKGYLVCKETKNSTVKDLKVKGKSLINLCTSKSLTGVGNGVSAVGERRNLNKPISNGTLITVAFDVSSDTDATNVTIGFYSQRGEGGASVLTGNVSGYKGTRVVRTVTVNSPYPCEAFGLYIFKESASGSMATISNIVILEGDHSQNPPKEYFEGISSVGTGVDKIEVSSIKADGNLLDYDKLIKASNTEFFVDNGDIHVTSVNPNAWSYVTFKNIKVEPNTKYYVKCDEVVSPQFSRFYITDGKGGAYSLLDKYGNVEAKYYEFTTNDTGLVNFAVYSNNASKPASTTIYKKLRLVKKECEYTPYKEDKKPILFKDTDGTWKPIKELRGLDTVCDTVELHSDGKYYYHIRTEKSVLNGTENIVEMYNLSFGFKIDNIINAKPNTLCICDTLKSIPYHNYFNAKEDGISIHDTTGTNIYFRDKSITSVDAWKQKLQADNIEFVYQLAEEKVFEVNPLFLEAYEGETSVLCDSGAISPDMEFKIASYITNLVLLNQQRISLIEQEMFNMFKQVLSGDMYSLAEKLYPEDFIEEKYIATPIPEL